MSVVQGVVFDGQTGSVALTSSGIVWTHRNQTTVQKFEKDATIRFTWTVFGSRGHIVFYMADGSFYRLDGFEPAKFDEYSRYVKSTFELDLEAFQPASDGSQFGQINFSDKSLSMKSEATGRNAFEMRLDNVAQCVIPGNSRNEVEIQFQDNDTGDKDCDFVSQIRLYFPDTHAEGGEEGAEEEEADGLTRAEEFQKAVMDRSRLRSVTGDVIVEFSKDQGNFITPRGRYAIQMYATFLRMHGEKYDYKIAYEDIDKLFLLHRPDGYTSAIVISLNKPIRQGNQRYPYLVLQTSREEFTVKVNLTQEEIASKYDNQLTPEVTMAMSSLIAKIFKVLSQSKVFVPKNFKSDKDAQAVKCSLKANEGLLYPLEKSFIFIHKPTLIIHFADIEALEFQRYATGTLGTRNFDIKITVKASAAASISGDANLGANTKDYVFSSIDKAEYNNLYDFLESKKLPIRTPKQEEVQMSYNAGSSDDEGGVRGGSEEDSEEDDDYEAGKSSASSSAGSDDEDGSGSGSGSGDDSGSAAESGGSGSERRSKKSKEKKRDRKEAKRDKAEKKSKKERKEREEVSSPSGKRKRGEKKDKNAPKRGKSAYNYYVEENTQRIKAAHPDAKFGEISKLMSESWKAESAEVKAQYEAKAGQDKLRYQEQMKSYVPADAGSGSDSGSGGGRKQRKKRAKKDKDAPKGPLSAFFVFSADIRNKVREEHPEMKLAEVTAEIGSRWRTMSAEEKAPYEEKSRADKERYAREIEAYKARKGAAAEEEEAASGSGSDNESGAGESGDEE